MPLLFRCSFFWFLASALHAADAVVVGYPPDLAAFWTFGEDVGQPRVSSVNSHTLTDGGASQVSRTSEGPFSGFSATFNGTSQYLKIPNAQLGNLNIAGADAQVTVVSWIKRNEANTGFIAGIWQEDNNDPRRQYGLFVDLPLYGGPNNVCGHVSLAGGASPSLPFSRDYSANLTPVLDGQWCTTAFTYDGTYARSFIDGKFEARPNYTEPGAPNGQGLTYAKNPYLFPDGLGDNGGDFTVGAVKLTSGMNNYYKGSIGGVAVYRRALSATELFQVHAAGLFPNAPATTYTFRNGGTTNATVASHSWRAFRNATTDSSNNTTTSWLISNVAGSGSEVGYLGKTSPFNETGIAWTDSVPAIPVHLIENVRFTLNNAMEADRVHLALRIAGQWFASATGYGVTGDGRVATNWTTAETKTIPFTRDAADWKILNFNASNILNLTTPLVALPSGTIESIGFYQPANAGTLRIDQLQITIHETGLRVSTYAAWSRNRNLIAEAAMPDGDPDCDGIVNLIEYAMGCDPLAITSGTLPQPIQTSVSGQFYHDLITTRLEAADLKFTCEQSDNLVDWHTLPPPVVLSSSSTADGTIETVRWRTSATSTPKFFRLCAASN